ncbi:type II toxin-antitoxin system RelE/ParE family toxin [Pandoraea capi]|uniref:type II toxin-antitoxin system RelE/ParE family toxin n=1 Tax=Pandoraea TaxID=93217 RepID=UPI001F5D82FD|nr:type II toxin-antitoxin system RelE/ParE family toxin [Pandoraea capi]MCI3206219.1 type II toxin-antitoxin system mRNA interferase toxin, RelE/StbE family [Pandoraea sp. LA3]MDN4584247.1 type II toxin-antitoxin system mRNA interferase toxin, RelE/StbE family [Pandoraea capi]
MRLEWSPHAIQDRSDIYEFVEERSPNAAIWIDSRIDQQLLTLLRFPSAGRPGRVPGTRELVITRTPYIAAYRPLPTRVRVLRIYHNAQMWP